MPSFTRNAIKQSFLKLLEQRPLNQITVKDIAEDCRINRNSFYYHFADIPTMITEIINEQADRIIAEHSAAASLEDCLQAVAQFMRESRRALLHLYRSTNRATIEDYLMRFCRHISEAYVQTAISQAPIREEDREILVRFCQCELFGQLIVWLHSGMSYDLEAQFSRLCQLMHGADEAALQRCAQPPS